MVCGRTGFGDQKTTAHHILKAENYPEHYFEELNSIVLCPVHHIPLAHDHEGEFLDWLSKHDPAKWKWADEHRHHRRNQ